MESYHYLESFVKEEKIEIFEDFPLNTQVKEEFHNEACTMNETKLLSGPGSIKQEIVNDLNTDQILEEYKVPIKTESDISNNVKPRRIGNSSKYLKVKSKRTKSIETLSQHCPLPGGILICKLCGNLYTRKFDFCHHVARHLVKKARHITLPEIKYKLEQNMGNPLENKSVETINVLQMRDAIKNKCWVDRLQDSSNHIKFRVNIDSKNSLFKCEICTKLFSFKSDLVTHQCMYTDEKPFKCDICSRPFARSSSLVQHTRFHAGEKPFKCGICLKSFQRKEDLKKHLLSHTGENPFKCGICLKSFTRSSSLDDHMRIHTGVKPFKCDICLKTFSIGTYLNRHLPIHTGEKPFRCDICLKLFYRKDYLKIHLITHTGEKPFKCDICLKSFTTSSSLVRHTRIHTGIKPFKCNICLKTFSDKGNLNKHLLSHAGK